MREDKEIPNGWEIVKTDFIGSLLRGISYKKNDITDRPTEGYLPILRANNINGELNFNDLVYVPKKYVIDDQIIKAGDIIFAMSSGSKHLVGKSAVAKNNFDGSYGAFCSLLRVNDTVNNKYIAYIFKGNSYRKLISEIAKGTNINNLKREHILDFEIFLPPLPEQHRIVAKIEELFSSLDKGIESLKTAQQQLKVYRQAVLKWAFEGKLTNKNVVDGELPEGWAWKQLKEITSVLGDGLHGTPIYSENGDYFFINGNNLSHGKIEIKENTKRVTFEEYEKYKKPLNKQTILVSINGTLGNTAFYNNEKVILGKSACYFNVLETIDKYFIRYCITSYRFINYANKNSTGSTIKNVGLKAMREFEIPIPLTLEEQHAIVAEIESRLSVCDRIEETINESLKQAEALRQSILMKAFEGKLVPQDPNDLPASVLLERIRKERTETHSTKAKKRSRQ